jgi:hypothetical protein
MVSAWKNQNQDTKIRVNRLFWTGQQTIDEHTASAVLRPGQHHALAELKTVQHDHECDFRDER